MTFLEVIQSAGPTVAIVACYGHALMRLRPVVVRAVAQLEAIHEAVHPSLEIDAKALAGAEAAVPSVPPLAVLAGGLSSLAAAGGPPTSGTKQPTLAPPS